MSNGESLFENDKVECPMPSQEPKTAFALWVQSMGGDSYVEKTFGLNASTINRYKNGRLKLPKKIYVIMKMSEENAQLRQENAQLKREVKALKNAP